MVNEPSHLAEPKIDQPYRWARQADPRAYLIVNDYYVLADGGPGFFKLLTAAKRSGVPFDGIGIQAHEPRTMRFPLDRVQEILDQYATLGKELAHHGVHAHVGRAEDHRFAPRGRLGRGGPGRLRREVLPRLLCPSGHAGDYLVGLERPGLVAARRRNVAGRHVAQAGLRAAQAADPRGMEDPASGTTDADGRFAFRGFYGDYRVVLERPEGKMERKIHVRRDKRQELLITLPIPPSR